MKNIFWILVFLPVFALAQSGSISGLVTDSKTGEPLPNATVFLGNATRQTPTSGDGRFLLWDIKPGRYDLIVSMVGYETFSQPVAVRDEKQVVNVSLTKKVFELGEVVVRHDPNRERYLAEFTQIFIGNSRETIYRTVNHAGTYYTHGAAQTTILNPEIIQFYFDQDSKELTAYSDDFLIIENKWLGYRVNYLLSNFSRSYRTNLMSYEGKVFFEEMKGSEAQVKRWQKNRMTTYLGSAMHFFRSMLQDQLEFNGFVPKRMVRDLNTGRYPENLIGSKLREFEKGNRDSLKYWQTIAHQPRVRQYLTDEVIPAKELVKRTDQPQLYALTFEDMLYVGYYKKPEHLSSVSVVELAERFAFFDQNGVLINPKSLIYEGAWTAGVGDLLPNDFVPDP